MNSDGYQYVMGLDPAGSLVLSSLFQAAHGCAWGKGRQQSRRARLAIDFFTDWACVSHVSDVLGVCIMITSALLRTETERWRENITSLVQRGLIGGFLGRLGMTRG